MLKRMVSRIMLTLVFIGMLTLAFNIQPVKAEPTTIIVPDDYPTIQEAINHADEGDTIFVYNGTYSEPQVTIDKPLQLIGENKSTTIIDGGGSWVCVYVGFTHNVKISGFTIQNGYGIYSYRSENVTIGGNIISNNGQGIVILESTNNTVSKNIVTLNGAMSIFLSGSNGNKICGNIVTLNSGDAVWLDNSHWNIISGNNVSRNGLGTSPGYHVYGIRLSYSKNNSIYHNYIIDNYEQASGWRSVNNTWDGGYPSGGNYWSDYTGVDIFTGSYQNETGSDGIGDTPYVIDENNTDDYPLMQPYHGPVRNLNTGQSYPTIQKAINNATDGDKIFVLSGTYYEHVVVNKTVSLIGQDRNTTIIDGNGTGNLVLVEGADNITITGFTVRNATVGFCVLGFNHTIVRNIVLNNTYHGIDLVGRDNYISENTITINRYGIILGASSDNIVRRNTIIGNQGGINLCEDCQDNDISKNVLMNNVMGIGIAGNNNRVVGNTIKENWSGIEIAGTNNIVYRNNFINNTVQIITEESFSTTFDNGCEGNYWSNYNGTDSDGDGIGDTPYVIDVDNQDNYPLMEPWGVVSGNLQILKPANGTVIVGSVNITFAIENTGWNIEFAKGDSTNRIDLEIEYTLNQTHGWGIKFWSTSNHGLNLSSGEEYTRIIIYDPSEYEEAVPPDFSGDAPYGEATIRLVHWKQIDTGYSYGEFGMTEINVTLQPVDTTPPTITLLSPQNKTYTTTSVPLTFTLNETTSWIGYSLDNQANVTITGNTTLTGLSEGTHSITVYANDTTGNMGASEIVYFTVALPYGPTAEFTVTPETADVGESVKFDASASLPGWNSTHDTPIVEYRWDFGGSIKITTSTPILYYSFISPGIYYVTLTVYAPGATPETDSVTHKVTITATPVGGYSFPIKGYTTEKPLTLYLALIAILTVSFTIIKRRKKQQS